MPSNSRRSRAGPAPAARKLDSFAPELLRHIASYLDSNADASQFAQSCRAIYGVLSPILHARLIAEFRQKDKLMKRVEKVMDEMTGKAMDLVWYARSDPDSASASLRSSRAKVEQDWPEEIEKLDDPGTSQWQYGFLSGQLGMARLVKGLLHAPISATIALEENDQWYEEDENGDEFLPEDRPTNMEEAIEFCIQEALNEFPALYI